MAFYYSPDTKGFYDDFSPSRPADAIEITHEQYRDLLVGLGSGKVIEIDNGAPVLTDPGATDEDLTSVKANLKVMVDVTAENVRMRFITGGAGQAMTYQVKAAEARAAIAETDPKASNYPMLAAEIGITGETLLEVAQVVFAAYSAWLVIGAQIEAARLGGKAAVDSAETMTAARDAVWSIAWPETGD